MNKAIFITNDNIELKQGDHVYCLERYMNGEIQCERTIDSRYGHPPIQKWHSSSKYFSTSEALGKYILEHIRGLSIDQVVKALGLKKNDKRINNLKEIIKSELKC